MKLLVSLLISISLLLGSCATAAAKKKELAKPAEIKTEVKPAEEAKPTEEVKPAQVKEEAPEPAPAKTVEQPAPNAPEQAKETTPPVDPEKVVVTVNGTVIREKQIIAEAAPQIPQIEAQAAKMAAAGWPVDEKTKAMMRDELRDNVVEMLIEKTLITEQLKANKIEVTDADVDARFLEIIKRNGKTPEQAEQEIKQQGMTVKDMKEQMQIYWQVGVEKLFAANAKDKDFTEADAKKFYDENPQSFKQPEQVRASHILIKTEGMNDVAKTEAKKKIEDILKKALSGEDFAQLAKTYSEDPGSKDMGGEYTFPKGKMAPEFEKAAFSLEAGKISDIVETQYGYHIIKLSEKIPAKTWSFDEVKTRLMERLKMQKIGQFWQQFSGESRKNAKIEWSPEEKVRRDQKEKEKQQQQMEIPPQPQTEQK